MAESYKVHDTGGLLFRYAVADPTGWLVTVTATRWGARRAIAKDKAKRAATGRADGYWTKPVVDEVPED